MKIQIASDLHLEMYAAQRRAPGGGYRSATDARGRPRTPEGGAVYPRAEAFTPVPGRDLLVLAGDIGTGDLAREFVERELAISPVLYVPGNHEYYARGTRRDEVDAGWKALAAERPGLHYLVGEPVEIDGCRIWGGPWYSDLWGTTPLDREGAWYHSEVTFGINDFWAGWNSGEWTLSRHINHHLVQTDLLRRYAGRVDVVVTHWPPTKEAIHPKFDGDSLNPYFINDKEGLVREIGAKLWISGHTHEAYDYQIGPTRCIGNPTGYDGEHRESRLFRPDKVVEAER